MRYERVCVSFTYCGNVRYHSSLFIRCTHTGSIVICKYCATVPTSSVNLSVGVLLLRGLSSQSDRLFYCHSLAYFGHGVYCVIVVVILISSQLTFKWCQRVLDNVHSNCVHIKLVLTVSRDLLRTNENKRCPEFILLV